MKKVFGSVVKWFTTPGSGKTIVNGIETVGKIKLDKKKVGVVIIAILAILLLSGAISEETFVELFSDVE